MLINLSDVFTNKISHLQKDFDFELDTVKVNNDEYTIAEKSVVRLKADNVEEGKAKVTCEFEVGFKLPCDRCLSDVDINLSVNYEEIISSDDDSEDACEFLKEYKLNIDELILSEITLNWPSKVLCSEECKGICTVCGANLNDGDCGCDRFVPNPAFAGLAEIFNTDKEV